MKSSIKDKLQKIDDIHLSILMDIGEVASLLNLKAYLVGGMVRDLLLGFKNLDIDIVVENNSLLLVDALVKRFSYCELSAKHDRFHTAKLVFNLNGKKIPVDLASTREEIYEYPAALPKVKITNLKKDLYRRDFTINALAVSILPEDFGDVVDLFDGLLDLQNKKVRVLHDFSFIDDPTRIIRAIRFSAKLGFEIEEHAQKLLKEAVDSKQFDNLIEKIRGDRVKIEIRYLFNLPKIQEAVNIFFNSGVYRLISTDLKSTNIRTFFTNVQNDIQRQWLIYLALIIKDLKPQQQEKIMSNLQLTAEEIKIIKNGFTVCNRFQTLISNNQKLDSVIVYRELKDLTTESISIVKMLYVIAKGETTDVNELIDEYIEKTSKIKLEITGADLINMGVKEGKKIGEILQKVLEIKIKNPEMKKEDEIKEAKRALQV